jgi:hypothetical protein
MLGLGLAVSVAQAGLISDFEAGGTTGWSLTAPASGGAVPVLNTTYAHSGTQSLYVPAGGEALYALSNSGFGDLQMFVYDPGTGYGDSNIPNGAYGARWGGASPDDTAPFMESLVKVSGISGNSYVGYYRSGGGGGGLDGTDPTTLWSRYSGSGTSRGSAELNWTQYDFNRPDAHTMTITVTFANGSHYIVSTDSNIATNASYLIPTVDGSNISPEWIDGGAGIGNIEIYGGNVGSGFSGTYIDDVSWTPAPEPATLALLVAGGLAMIARRKKA